MISPTSPSGVGAPFAGLPVGASGTAPAPAPTSPYGPDHVTKAMHDDAIATIDLNKTANSDPALQSALKKMKAGVDLLLSLHMDALSDATLRALWHKNNEADDAATRSRDKIHAHFDRLASQNQERLHHIQARMHAKESQSFWQKLAGVFKSIANVVGAITAASGGTLGLLAAACMATSMVMSAAGANEWATFGVGLGGALLSLGVNSASTGLKAIAQQMGKYAGIAMRVAEAVANYEVSEKEADALDADAELQALRDERQQLLEEADKEREAIESLRQAAHRSALTVIETLSLNHRTKLAALGA